MKLIPDEKKLKNEEILKAALTVFGEYGFKKTSIDDIAKKLDLVRSALYYYYKSKEELFAAVIEFEADLFHEKLLNLISRQKSTEGKLLEFAIQYNLLYKRFVNVYQITFDELYKNYKAIAGIRKKIISNHAEIIFSIMKNDPALKKIKNHDDVSGLFFKTIKGIIRFIEEPNGGKLEAQLKLFCTVFYKGLLYL